MRNSFIKVPVLIATIAASFSACKKDDPPRPVEQELITTLRLMVNDNGSIQSFDYRVENGFNNSSQGSIHIDTIVLAPHTSYTVDTRVLNEKENPMEDITLEVIDEKDDHLFLYRSNPASGAGSIVSTGGDVDGNGDPFNQTISFTTGAPGSGTLTVYLIHEPTDKAGLTPEQTGGETDVQAVFPVKIQ